MRLILTVLLSLATASIASAQQPNIVLILTDDQSVAQTAFMPKLKSLLVDQGVTFANAFNDFPLCCPSRATWHTGQAAHNHGVLDNDTPKGGYEKFMAGEANSLGPWMQAAGYRTGYIGKHLNGYGERSGTSSRVPTGWDSWAAITKKGSKAQSYYYGYQLNVDGTLVNYGTNASDYSTDVFADKAVTFIASPDPRPFFLVVAPNAPHYLTAENWRAIPAPRHVGLFANEPLPQTPNFNEADVSDKPNFLQNTPKLSAAKVSDLTTYWRTSLESLQSVDDLIERAVFTAPANTCFIFASDNGMMFGNHRLVSKYYPYEESIRIPLVVRCPGMTPAVRNELVVNYDVVATILNWAGATPGRVQDGKPLFGAQRSAFYIHGSRKTNDGALVFWDGVRTQTRKYAKQGNSGGAEELYDLVADPYELENKAGDPAYATDLSALRALRVQLSTCVGAGCWVP
jgi:N-acetylglucosamine-6-sulfatase